METKICGMLLCLAVLLAAAFAPSCARDESAAGARSTPASSPPLDQPLILWKEGQPDEAVAAMIEVPWNDPAADFSLPLLMMSERQFVRKPAGERIELSEEATALAGEIRSLARAVHAEYRRLHDEGQLEDAERLMDSLGHFARRLQDPGRRLALFSMIGEAIQDLVDQHNSGAPSR